ncbi:thiamine diphosphokinase [Lentibacillus cibarius]|uniref:Thiamine diphosphokinase n=1 Tax=Lentibacillus cibarius TaxID=2583219 RepID=A0A5S3QNX9_9BACI|nr:thiamine diphosphokinase [Lentibacillus cibarius]TMN23535.1 thiamine diphosphokinase [Lentibacillus cibarius]
MRNVAIMGNGPKELIPDLESYQNSIDVWIGADRGSLILIENSISPDYAVGDFDSMDEADKEKVYKQAKSYQLYPSEKDQTDLEIALQQAYTLQPDTIYLFGVTGGRLDHALINIQLLHVIMAQHIRGVIIDRQNQLELIGPGNHEIRHDHRHPNISFIPYTQHVEGLTLEGFYYPLVEASIAWGSTLCISNKLILNYGTFSFKEGILLIIKSCDE